MEQVHANIQSLAKKLTQLKENYDHQKLLIENLQQENKQLRNTIELQKQQHPFTYEQGKIKAILQQLPEQKGDELKKLIEGYIKQIDQCIDLLEKST